MLLSLAGIVFEVYGLYKFARVHSDDALIDNDSKYLLQLFAILGFSMCMRVFI